MARKGGIHMPPVRLSDDELSAVMSAARPLPLELRDPFLQAVAHALSACDVVGPGTVHRVCAETQRAFFDAPDFSHGNAGLGKYGRTG
jgi:hypothetical protein